MERTCCWCSCADVCLLSAAEKLSFPLGLNVKKSLHKVATPQAKARPEITPRQEFNYDTSSTITGTYCVHYIDLFFSSKHSIVFTLADDEEDNEEDSDRPSESDHDDRDADEGGSMVNNTTIRTGDDHGALLHCF